MSEAIHAIAAGATWEHPLLVRFRVGDRKGEWFVGIELDMDGKVEAIAGPFQSEERAHRELGKLKVELREECRRSGASYTEVLHA